jgi:uncharacterized protein (DUF1501 family)
MNRRTFIKDSAIAATMPFFLNALSACHIQSLRQSKNKILVLIQLIGGNDGLNTLIPLDNYHRIAAARPNLFIPENKVLSLKGSNPVGLHPSLDGIKDLYNNDLVSFVQGVGFTHPVLSHFRAQDIWLTGSDTSVLSTGWMARYLETRYYNYPKGFPSKEYPHPPAIKIGDTGNFLFQSTEMDMSVIINPSTGFQSPELDISAVDADSFADIEMKSISEIMVQTQRYSKVLKSALASSFEHSKMYPQTGENPLADQLKIVAKLVKSDLQTSVYMVDLKGFDTHQGQVDPSNPVKGVHADLLKKMSEAITSFWDDIGRMGRENDVTGMAFSEFGRRIMSNASAGTDHGSSQPILFFGTCINAGIIGANPIIPDRVTVEDNLSLQYDYRSVYFSLLKNWLNVKPSVITDVLLGDFPEIRIFK